MKLDKLKQNEHLIPYVLLGVAALLAILALVKVGDFFATSARARSIVQKAAALDKSDPNLLQANLAGLKDIADALKKRNLFVPPEPRRHPVNEVFGILGNEAFINDGWRKVGDTIGDARVVAIEPTQVKIEWDGQTKSFAPLTAAGSGSASGPGGRPGRGDKGEGGPGPGTVVVGPDGGPGRGGFGDLSEEQRAEMRGMRDRFSSMSPEERERFRDEMRMRFGDRGPGGPGGPGGDRGPGGGGFGEGRRGGRD
jgi:hypothetical protein